MRYSKSMIEAVKQVGLYEMLDYAIIDGDNKIIGLYKGGNAKKQAQLNMKGAERQVGIKKPLKVRPVRDKKKGDTVIGIGEQPLTDKDREDIDEDVKNALAGFDNRIRDASSMDKKDFIKAKVLYKRKDVKGLRKHIYSLDTSPLEVVMNLISIQDRPFFDKMYPNTRGGEFLARIAYQHRNLDEKLDENKDDEKKRMKGAKLRLKMGDALDEKFTKKDFDDNEDKNKHTENGVAVVNMFGTSAEKKKMADIAARHNKQGSIGGKDQKDRDAMVNKYYKRLKEGTVKEDGHTDVSSAVRQCKTITEDAMQIMGKLKSMSGEDSLPTWWTNKLAVASNSMNKIRDYLLVPSMQEGLDEGKMSQIATSIDDIANAMKKDRNMKPFIDKFKKDARKTLDPKKSLEKVLPDYIPGRDVEKLKNMAEQIDERMKTPRQLINPNKEVMIVKNNKVIVIDKKDQDKYMKKGWELAEKLDKEDEPKVKEIIKMLKKASNAHAGQAKDLEKAVNERELTPRELKRREEIAKKLDLKDFEKRYGKDKGMNVKMAVATKMAKKETEEGTKFYRDITSKDLLENKYKDAKNGAQHFSKVDETEYVWNFVYDDFGRTKLTTEPDKATHLVYTMEGLDNPKLLKISEREILDYKKGENNELSKKKKG